MPNLKVLLDHDVRLSFYRGEDRTVRVQVQNAQEQAPFDLTGLSLAFSIPKSGGGSIVWRSSPLDVSANPVVVLNGDTFFQVTRHGLVDGQLVSLQALSDQAALPLPFTSGSSYRVLTRSDDEFCLRTLSNQSLAVGSPSIVQAAVEAGGLEIIDAKLGEARLALSAIQTLVAAIGQGQSYQLDFVDASGKRTIYSNFAQLDVQVPPCP